MNIIAWIFEFFGVFIGSIILILILDCVINFIHYVADRPPCYWKSRIKECDVIYSSINKDQAMDEQDYWPDRRIDQKKYPVPSFILWFLVSYTPLRDKMSEKYNGNT